jgi:hypothetical protein
MADPVMMWPGYQIDIAQDGQWVESGMPERDPDWKMVDENGHGHFVDKNGELPTLRWVAQPCSMGHGDDCDSEGYFECLLCGEVISPGTRTPKPFYVAGMTTYTLTTETSTYEFGPTQWDALQAAIGATIESTLAEYCVKRTYGVA